MIIGKQASHQGKKRIPDEQQAFDSETEEVIKQSKELLKHQNDLSKDFNPEFQHQPKNEASEENTSKSIQQTPEEVEKAIGPKSDTSK